MNNTYKYAIHQMILIRLKLNMFSYLLALVVVISTSVFTLLFPSGKGIMIFVPMIISFLAWIVYYQLDRFIYIKWMSKKTNLDFPIRWKMVRKMAAKAYESHETINSNWLINLDLKSILIGKLTALIFALLLITVNFSFSFNSITFFTLIFISIWLFALHFLFKPSVLLIQYGNFFNVYPPVEFLTQDEIKKVKKAKTIFMSSLKLGDI